MLSILYCKGWAVLRLNCLGKAMILDAGGQLVSWFSTCLTKMAIVISISIGMGSKIRRRHIENTCTAIMGRTIQEWES